MSLQTNVFENGRWVTRNIDPYQARAQNAEPQRKEKTATPSLNLATAPSLGLITHTLVRSPVIKWIIPARIRHPQKNDVLFITADSLTIKEAKGNYTLHDIAAKTDFDSPIRSARVLGDRRRLTRRDIYGFANREIEWDEELPENEYYPEASPLQLREIPLHILVLALESDKLIFLFAISGKLDHPEFLCYQKELPAAPSPLAKLGEHIAVDAKSVTPGFVT